MGLLDMIGNAPPETGIGQGLLGMASALLTPRSRGGGLGAAFAALPQAQAQAQAQAMRQKMFGLQEREFGLRNDEMELRKREAERAAAQEAARLAQLESYIGTLPPDQQQIARLAPQEFVKSQVPQRLAPTEIERLTQQIAALPDGHPNKAIFQKRLEKLLSHPPASQQNVYTGTLTAGEIDGKPAFLMGGKDGSVTVLPGVQPPGTAAAESKDAGRKQLAIRGAEVVLKKVDDALDKVGFTTTGAVGAVVGNIPGTEAYDLRRAAETIKANLGFDQLQQMRDNSPTGGALGQVAVQELAMLQAAVANLDPNQSPAELRKNLMEIRSRYANVLKLMKGEDIGSGRMKLDVNGATPPQSDPLGIRQ